MVKREIDFQFKARYYKLGDIDESTRAVWFVLHGYGQLAQYFITKFRPAEASKISIIAPEGLSRFYVDELRSTGRKTNRVGATWMTRENREMDIQNYINYLDRIYKSELKNTSIPVTVLGFSQGAATACRWVMNRIVAISRLVLWAGILPPDMNFEESTTVLRDKKIQFVYGRNDPFMTAERLAEMNDLTRRLQASVELITFDGGHDIDEATLRSLFDHS